MGNHVIRIHVKRRTAVLLIIFTTEHLLSIWGIGKLISIHAIDKWCENALDLSNGKLIVENNWPAGTNCQWLISAVDDEHYVNLEFANLGVRIAELNLVYLILHFFIYLDHILA